MLKIIAALIILFSATMIGFQLGKHYRDRVTQLRILLLSLQMLETEIVYGSTPLYLAFQKIGGRVTQPVALFYQKAGEFLLEMQGESTQMSWHKAIEKTKGKMALQEEELEVWKNVGLIIGGSDREDQKKHLQLAMSHLQSLEDEAKSDQNRYEKMYKNLGFLSGLLVVILMM
ncbi:stage III sporulation protein SpoIIIAB [Brevibacillus daliensis]|uniref:stage III sporulation protein SpoIIIAB n=1 Tax=Brevibacillus daliensis TaxID=2892995 RepID=UPI001E564BC1|nr:stage III sporulation protein SpoIIIAB [Brevibacillus daliensis]